MIGNLNHRQILQNSFAYNTVGHIPMPNMSLAPPYLPTIAQLHNSRLTTIAQLYFS